MQSWDSIWTKLLRGTREESPSEKTGRAVMIVRGDCRGLGRARFRKKPLFLINFRRVRRVLE